MGTSYTVRKRNEIGWVVASGSLSRHDAVACARDSAIARPGERYTVFADDKPLMVSHTPVSFCQPAPEPPPAPVAQVLPPEAYTTEVPVTLTAAQIIDIVHALVTRRFQCADALQNVNRVMEGPVLDEGMIDCLKQHREYWQDEHDRATALVTLFSDL